MSPQSNSILVPIDFSEQSLIALGQCYNLTRLTKADIVLLYVMDEDPSRLIASLFKSKQEENKEIENAIELKLNELAEKTSIEAGVKVHTKIRRGKIYEQIVEEADELKPVFVIMGTNGSVGIKRFIGSNAMRVIKEAHCPVITIKGKSHRFGCKNIVLPLDLTKETKEKVNKAIEMAGYFGSTIRVLTVYTSDDEFLNNKLTRQLNQVQHFIEDRNIPCTIEALNGDNIASEVVSYANRVEADLIMIMTQEEMNWTDLFISSAAQEVINNSDIPVLSIRPVEKKDMSVFVPY
jgi:nucleotide-binding universal stress UspA family protein